MLNYGLDVHKKYTSICVMDDQGTIVAEGRSITAELPSHPADGAVVNTYEYDVFGAVRSSTGSQANEFKFTGEQVDATTGLEFLRARYYDQGTGFVGTRKG